jgi:hypothetical protein
LNFVFYFLAIVLFPALHLLNAKLFFFAEFNSHISLIYLPAFLRLFNVLVFGALPGTVITFLGGMLLFPYMEERSWMFVANDACSALGPLIALAIFRFYSGKQVSVGNLKHLIALALLYTFSNALIHHLVWNFGETNLFMEPVQFFEMLIGDLIGTFIGVLLLKIITDLSFVKRKIYNTRSE